MSFDIEPDHDEHALCRQEIHGLNAKIEQLQAEIQNLKATGNACQRLAAHLYDREDVLYKTASLDPALIPAAHAEVSLREVRRAIKIVMAFTTQERGYLNDRTIEVEKQREAAEAARKKVSKCY